MKLEITEQKAKQIYPKAPEWFQDILTQNFKADVFRKKDFKDFKTFEDLCQAAGTSEIEFNQKWNTVDYDPSTVAFEKMKVMTWAYNQDWPFNTYDTNQRKWYPWFEVLSSGFGFSGTFFNCDSTYATVGSRLCFESEEKANHAGRTFTKLFEEFITAKF